MIENNTIISNNSAVTLQESTLQGRPDYGGGIYNEVGGTVSIFDSQIHSNMARDDIDPLSSPDGHINKGGGIYNDGIMTIINSHIHQNEARSKGITYPVDNYGNVGDPITKSHAEGSGIYNNSVLHIENSTISDHTMKGDGAGIFNVGTLAITSASFYDNYSDILTGQGIPSNMRGNGGGIYNAGTITNLENSIFSSSTSKKVFSGSGIYNAGSMTVNLCQFEDLHASNDGGAIFNCGTGSSLISESSFFNNSAGVFGGAVANYGSATLTLNVCTIAQNSAGGRDTDEDDGNDYYKTGCGIANGDSYPQDAHVITFGKATAGESTLNLINCTIADNEPATRQSGYSYFGNGLLLGQNSITAAERVIITRNTPSSNIYPGNIDIESDVEVTIDDNGLNVIEITNQNTLAKSTDDANVWTNGSTWYNNDTTGLNLSMNTKLNTNGIPVLPLSGGSFVFSRTATGFIGSHDYRSDGTLPVELSFFRLSQSGKGVLLRWATESELNNAGFILERRETGLDWEIIADYKTNESLKGAGNASEKNLYQFLDAQVSAGKKYAYRLSDVDFNGKIDVHNDLTREVVIQSDFGVTPNKFQLSQAYPNPFNPVTMISYSLPEEADVELTIFDLQGRPVQTLVNTTQNAGKYAVEWQAVNLGSGFYFYKLKAGDFVDIKKCMLVK